MESQGREGAARILRSPSSHKALCSFYLFYFPFAHAPRRANEKESLHTHTHAGAGRKAEASFVNEISRRHKAVKQCEKGRRRQDTPRPLSPGPRSNPSGKSRGERMHREPSTTHHPPRPEKQRQTQTMPPKNTVKLR